MKRFLVSVFLLFGVLISAQDRYDVSSSEEFKAAQIQASEGDSIVWQSGVYSNTRMDIDQDGLIVTAEPHGTVLFNGVSRAVINGDAVTFSGFQYVGGFIANLNVINVYGSDVLITQVNIQNYTSHKYLVVDEDSKRTTISYCNFENRLNLDDKNILSILVDDEPGYHKIQWCSFKNFVGIGADQGIEPIRIGVSSQGELDSRTIVEYCYFTRCNGDGEIISHKSRQNVYRYNTFENNPYSELVLRHGDEGIVYGNFFLNNRGGVRIREGSHHFIYNNYFEGIEDRAIWLMNDPADPLSNVHIYHNTFNNTEEIRLGGNGDNPPDSVIIANNIFTNPLKQLFDDETGNETWINNFSFGDLGIDLPASGLVVIDPQLYENSEGYVQPEENSPVISAASSGYPEVSLYPGMDYDDEIQLDLMQESRPATITERAIGASEFSTTARVQPHATEFNTGPSYLFDNLVDYLSTNATQFYIGEEGETRLIKISSNIDWSVMSNDDWIATDLLSGSGDAQVSITIAPNQQNMDRSGTVTIAGGTQSVTITIFQDANETVGLEEVLEYQVMLYPNPTHGTIHLKNLPVEYSSLVIELHSLDGKRVFFREYQLDDSELVIDLESLIPGAYTLNVKFRSQNGMLYSELTRRFLRN